jgi:cysteine desulfurase/selenocysteine lyase
MASLPRIYLDNAATSWPKPNAVYEAVDHYQRCLGAPAGRSTYSEAAEVMRAIEAARASLARMLQAAHPRQIVFAANGTDALNLAISGILRPGDHVVATVCEHNSVLRPLRHLETHRQIEVTLVGCDGQGYVDPDDVGRALRPNTRLVAVVHASNVTGALQPMAEIAARAHAAGALLLVDAAQSLGHRPCDVNQLGADLLAAPGHKGLLGPLGTGLLYIAPGLEAQLQSLRQGGTGTRSEEDRQPESLPDKYEAGNLNVPGLVGLAAALRHLEARGLVAVEAHERALTERLLAGLGEIAGVRLHGPPDSAHRVGVVSITIDGYDPQEVAATLDASFRVQVRSGLHCAPRMHEALGTMPFGGTVRFSLGPFSTPADVDAAAAAVAQIAAAAH